MKKGEKTEKRYCSYCGAQMIMKKVPAETENTYYYGINVVKRPMGSPYDIKTGKKQWVREYICPNYVKKKWWVFTGDHDKYFDDRILTNRAI